jgi:hypothetical protein
MKRLLVLLVPTLAYAEPPKLELTHEPTPRHLRMRPRTAAAPAMTAKTAAPTPMPQPPAADADTTYVRDVTKPISVRFNLGYQVDGTTVTSHPNLGGKVQTPGYDLDTIHAYGFGEAYLSTRGVGLESLSTYFASRFQLNQRELVIDPTNPQADSAGHVVTPPPVATWFDRSGLTPMALWGEVSDFLGPKSLAPLRVRAGAQYVYGPWMMHMYGVLAAWEGKLIRGEVYVGSRVPDYTLAASDQLLDRAGIGGYSAHVDLRDLSNPIPVVLAIEGLSFTHLGSGDSKPSNHGQVEADWRPNRDLALIGQARWLENQLANEHAQLRARYSQVTNIVVDLTHHHVTDWQWDPSLVGNEQSDPLAAKRYLDLGPVLAQYVLSARAGTLIAENVDLYGRFAASRVDPAQAGQSSYLANYIEGGGALEVRLRRTIAIGLSGLSRGTKRPSDPRQMDIQGTPQPLAVATNPAAMGERSFTELGATMRMNLGARKFSALVEIYGRYTQYVRDYCLDTRCGSSVDTGVPNSDVRGGGRFQIDAWIRDRLRLFASYDVSSALQFAPEITGYKSIRLIMEGVY